MSTNLHYDEVQEAELAKYGGWQEQQVPELEGSAQSQTSAPVPLLDEADYVTPEQIQQTALGGCGLCLE